MAISLIVLLLYSVSSSFNRGNTIEFDKDNEDKSHFTKLVNHVRVGKILIFYGSMKKILKIT
jgi:hypothetical protein